MSVEVAHAKGPGRAAEAGELPPVSASAGPCKPRSAFAGETGRLGPRAGRAEAGSRSTGAVPRPERRRAGGLAATDPGAENGQSCPRLAPCQARRPSRGRNLHHLHRWPLRDIAAHLGRTTTAVAGLIKRALKQLRIDLEGNDNSCPTPSPNNRTVAQA